MVICLTAAVGAAVMLGSTCSVFNKAPTVPVISGPSAGIVGVPVTFRAIAADPENDSITFQFDWGDSTALAWTNLVASGETATVQHTYSDSGTFSVKAKAKDEKGKASALTDAVALDVVGPTQSYPDSVYGTIATADGNYSAVVTPDGQYLYVANVNDSFLTPVRLVDRTLLPRVNIGGISQDLEVSPDGSRLYVSRMDGAVVALDLPALRIDTTATVGSYARGVTVSGDGRLVLVSARDDQRLAVLNSADLSVVDTVALGDGPTFSVLSPDGHTAYVSVPYHSFAVVDMDSAILDRYIPDMGLPDRLAITSDGSRLYAAEGYARGLRVLSLPGGTEITQVAVPGGGPTDVALSPDGSLALVAARNGLWYVDTRMFAVVCSLPGAVQGRIAVRPAFDSLYLVQHARILVIGRH